MGQKRQVTVWQKCVCVSVKEAYSELNYIYRKIIHKWGIFWKLKTGKGAWEMTRERERYDREISCPLVVSALFIMPSPSSQMSPVRLSVWHWYGSTSLWHKLLLWLVITLLQISCTHPPRDVCTPPHASLSGGIICLAEVLTMTTSSD